MWLLFEAGLLFTGVLGQAVKMTAIAVQRVIGRRFRLRLTMFSLISIYQIFGYNSRAVRSFAGPLPFSVMVPDSGRIFALNGNNKQRETAYKMPDIRSCF